MRRSKRSKADIIIDLTSLLDVIFIVLLIVVCNQQRISEKTAEENQTAQEMQEEASALINIYQDQIDTADNLNQYVWGLSVYSSYEHGNETVRHIRVLKEGQEIDNIELVGNNVAEQMDEFKAILEEYITSNSEQPVILSLNEDDEEILYRDEKAITKIYDELKETYDNVFIK